MTNYEAATLIFRRLAYDEGGEEQPPEMNRALLMAIWALMDQARYED